jgi:hypothetical protein
MKYLSIIIVAMSIFCSCHSPKKLFHNEVAEFKATLKLTIETYSELSIAHLPEPVQRYILQCGLIGITIANHAEVIWGESHIKMRPNQKWMRLETIQHNFVTEPSRLAYMRANMMGIIPFEGRDKYHNGNGHMFGTLGKMIKIFDEKDLEIAQGAAIVVLAEALLVPSFAIQPYIRWEPVDSLTAKARFIHKGIDVGGTFHFNQQGEYVRFTTDERPYMMPKGGYEPRPYTIEIRSYQQQGDIRIAKEVAAIWNLPEGDFEYWKGTIKMILFD